MPSRLARRTSGARNARPASFIRLEMSDPRGRSPACGWLADIRHLGGAAPARHADSRGSADQARLGFVELLEGRRAEPADHLAPMALRFDHAGETQDAEVPADQRLR